MAVDYLKNLLSPELQSKLDSVKTATAKIWQTQKLQHFTLHDIGHSENVIRLINSILSDMKTMNKELTENEIFILLASAYLHDIGMQSAHHAGLPEKGTYSIDDMKIIRDQHHETSSKIILESVDPNSTRKVNCGLADCTEPNYVRFIALLSKSHRKDKPGILSNLLDDDYLKTGEKIRNRLLVALLRFADELDRDYMRVSLDELKLWDIPIDSKVYWWLHHYTKAVEIENGIIKVLFRIPISYRNDQRNIDEIIFREVLEAVDNQYSEIKRTLWESGIYLDLEKGCPKEDDKNYTDDPSVQPIPEDGIKFINNTFNVQKSAQELTKKTGVIYWVDGLPRADDEKLKELVNSALYHAEKKQYIRSIKDIDRALLLTVRPNARMALKLILGNCYLRIGNNEEAIKNYFDVLAISGIVDNVEGKLGSIAAYGNLSEAYRREGNLDKSLAYNSDALKMFQAIGDLENQISALGNMVTIYKVKDELDKALKYYHATLKTSRKIGHKEGEASALGDIGVVYYRKGELDKALKYHRDALKIHSKIGHKEGEASALGNIGVVYQDKGELDKALKYHRDALKIHSKIGHKEGEASALGNIGLVYQTKGELDKALKFQNEALKIARKISYKQGEALVLGNIGIVYQDKGELDKALKYLKDACAILDEHNLVWGKDVFKNAIKMIEQKE